MGCRVPSLSPPPLATCPYCRTERVFCLITVSDQAVDMIFLADITGNEKTAILTQTYPFLKNLLNFFDFNSAKSQLGFVQYAADRRAILRMFSSGEGLKLLQNRISTIPNNPSRKPLETILAELHSSFKSLVTTGRSSTPKVCRDKKIADSIYHLHSSCGRNSG